MKIGKIQIITVGLVASLLGTPVLSFAKAGGGYRGGGRGSSQGGSMSSSSVGSRGSRTFEQNGFRPIERSAASPGSAAGAPPHAGPGVPPSAAASPSAQPSFFQRNPVLSGIAAGLAGSWIGHMLFGATSTPAAVHDGQGNSVNQEDGSVASSSGPSGGLLVLLMALAAAGVYYVYKRRNASLLPAFTGFGSAHPTRRSNSPAWVPPSVGVLSPLSSEPKLTDVDHQEFRDRLIEIQAVWSRQDIQGLRQIATPEMVQYFNDKLTDNASGGVENRVEDVVVLRAEVRESWAEDARRYATVLLQWKARDYVRSLAKQPSDPGYVVEGDARMPTEVTEAWTFVKHQDGKWLLSAIQEVDVFELNS